MMITTGCAFFFAPAIILNEFFFLSEMAGAGETLEEAVKR